MTIATQTDRCTLHLGDCIEVMRTMPESSVDSVVTDPPYGIGFMGKAWDGKDIAARATKRREHESRDPTAWSASGGHNSAAAAGRYDLSPHGMRAFQEFTADWAREAFRVMKPGAHIVVFASPRTYHRMVCGLEEAGFEVRDQIMWLFGSGFPKSHNLHDDWEGWGTALKPAHEPICLARKPLIGTVVANVLAHGTGALNIDECRVGWPQDIAPEIGTPGWGGPLKKSTAAPSQEGLTVERRPPSQLGRWPANVIHDGSDEVLNLLPEVQGGGNKDGLGRREPKAGEKLREDGSFGYIKKLGSPAYSDAGSAARFFYCAKASRADRNEGLGDLPDRDGGMNSNTSSQHITRRDGWQPAPVKNAHPTVKPTDLMRYLCRLITPPGGAILDPFMGSGSTGKAAMLEGFRFIGIEQDPEHIEVSRLRIAHAADQPHQYELLDAQEVA